MAWLSGVLIRIAEKISRFIERHEIFTITLILTIFSILSIWDSTVYPFWFDELFSFNIAHLPKVQNALRAMPADGQPPLHYIFIRLSSMAFGSGEVSTRLYSTFAYVVAALATYLIIRRLARPVYAFVSMMMVLSARVALVGTGYVFGNLAHSARPYSLLLCFTALAVLAWQRAKDSLTSRTPALLGMTGAIAGAVCTHFYGAIHVAVPLAAGETVRLVRRKRADWTMYAFMIAGFLTILAILPIAQESRRVMGDYVKNSTIFWAKPTRSRLWSTYGEIMPPDIILEGFLILVVLMYPFSKESNKPEKIEDQAPVPWEEFAAASALALLVPFQMVMTAVTTGYFMSRYAVGSLIGVALMAGLVLALIDKGKRILDPLAACATVWMLIIVLWQVPMLVQMTRNRPSGVSQLLAQNNSNLPIVVDSALDYATIWWYATSRLRPRLLYLSDLPFAVRQRDFLPELSLSLNQAYLPMKLTPYRDFVTTHQKFLLFSPGNPQQEWTRNRLDSEGWWSILIGHQGYASLYLMEKPNR